MRNALSAVVFGGLLASAVPVAAHHSFAAEFDDTKSVTLKGSVKLVEWVNPHTWIHMDVKSPDGTLVTWRIEGGAPNAMYRHGWTKNSLKIGDEITVNGFMAKDGTPTANARSVIMPNGKEYGAASSAGGAVALPALNDK